jgi:hypothetical protein
MPRDDFSKNTKETLAKRVGYLCSNPRCRRHTAGPHEDVEKVATIGVAAHITAASEGGPRYDAALTKAERSHINNGIWLCVSCSTIIDKDPAVYPVELLREWKSLTETFIRENLSGAVGNAPDNPFIEVDLLYDGSSRWNEGYSQKNKEIYGTAPIPPGSDISIHWLLNWSYVMVLVNNSTKPAFNIQIEPISGARFKSIDGLPKVNNIRPYENIDLHAQFERGLEGTAECADSKILKKIPNELDGSVFRVKYFDEARKEHSTKVTILDQEVISKFEK